jgi:PAS domain S-box-containing protein
LHVLLPLAAAGVLIVAWVLLGWLPGDPAPGTRYVLAAMAGIGLLGLLGIAGASLQAAPRGGPVPPAGGSASPDVAALEARLAEREQALELARRRCEEAESRMRAAEERYALAVRSASDGLWEWDLRSGALYLSPRWKSMLGFGEEEIPGTREAWLGRIHPEDRAEADAALDAHLRGEAPRYEHQHRLLHKDGGIRWVLSRGAAIRHASGRAYRVIGLDTDITRVRRIEDVLREMAEGTSGAYGDMLFRSLVQHFALALQVPRAFITECCDWPPTRVRALAHWAEGGFADTFEYELKGTPCEGVMEGRTCFYPQGVGELFPREKDWESYLGVPVYGSAGRVIGHLAFLDRRPMPEELPVDAIFRVFAARAGAELERLRVLEELRRVSSAPA